MYKSLVIASALLASFSAQAEELVDKGQEHKSSSGTQVRQCVTLTDGTDIQVRYSVQVSTSEADEYDALYNVSNDFYASVMRKALHDLAQDEEMNVNTLAVALSHNYGPVFNQTPQGSNMLNQFRIIAQNSANKYNVDYVQEGRAQPLISVSLHEMHAFKKAEDSGADIAFSSGYTLNGPDFEGCPALRMF